MKDANTAGDAQPMRSDAALRLLLILGLLFPLALVFLLPGQAMGALHGVFWVALLFCLAIVLWIMGHPEKALMPGERRALTERQRPAVIDEVIEVESALALKRLHKESQSMKRRVIWDE